VAGGIGFLCLLMTDRTRHPRLGLVLLVLIAVPAVAFPVVGLYQGILGGAEGSPALSIALLILVLALLSPQLALVTRFSTRLVPAAVGGLGVALLVAGSLNSGFDAAHPRPENLLYILDTATGEAYWASLQRSPDDWTRHFLGDVSTRTLDDLLGAGGPTTLLTSPAPALQLPAPELVLRGDERDGDLRTLRLHLSSLRQAWRAYVVPGPGVELMGAALGDGSPVALQTSSLDVPGLPPEGLDFTFRVRALGPASFVVIDQSSGLPDVAGASQPPATVMAAPTPDNLRGFATVVHRQVVFP
jgi:hypothetical protein